MLRILHYLPYIVLFIVQPVGKLIALENKIVNEINYLCYWRTIVTMLRQKEMQI